MHWKASNRLINPRSSVIVLALMTMSSSAFSILGDPSLATQNAVELRNKQIVL
ncbi:hypothetical protein LHFGNBLO_002220 [Mesorhizobium sp. AR10]|uniref:hypothetical protein n=1 Tax=Mesorhizobium sp. AR10 TaxID=2865839 RepID=UPI00215F1780|nr:hypothetical protein [Mesorhizobium sp. AR10]UVK40713.1 hypothetical protein LHFGNBLO_002220 [Mesorhizobium sp. AR10]